MNPVLFPALTIFEDLYVMPFQKKVQKPDKLLGLV